MSKSAASRNRARPRPTVVAAGASPRRAAASPHTPACLMSPAVSRHESRAAPAGAGCALITQALPAALIGASLGLLTAGVLARMHPVHDPALAQPSGLLAGLLAALAAGIAVPQRVAWWIGVRTWRRVAGRADEQAADRAAGASDHDVQRLIFAIVALVGGAATALAPILCRFALAAHDFLETQFLWTRASSAVLVIALGFAIGLLPLSLLGLAASCAHRMASARTRWEPAASGALLIGAGIGGSAGWWVAMERAMPEAAMLAGALPALAAALLVGAGRADKAAPSLSSTYQSVTELPTRRDRWPRLLRWGIVAVAACGAWMLALSTRAASGVQAAAVVCGGLVLLGTGWWLGDRIARRREGSIGSFGVACAAAGAACAAAMLTRTHGTVAPFSTSAALTALSLGAVGFALCCGNEALLVRAASRSAAGTVVLTRQIVAGGLVWALGAPLSVVLLGSATAAAACALSLLALGGVLVIHEPEYAPRSRRNRLLFVFAAVAAMIGLAPAATPADNIGVDSFAPPAVFDKQ